ncbi:MAG: single-stranded DNA-binding protein [Clostridia bacterium]|nr:single-stranded DNA-binding protein [Clostridia bacterium]
MANLNLNKVILAGRLTADPELKKTTNTDSSVCSFTVAVNRRYAKPGEQAQTDFIDCVAWRQQAEFLSRYFRKGSSVCIVGSIQKRTWTDQQGSKRYTTEVIADEINFVDAKGEGPSRDFSPEAVPQTPAYSTSPEEITKFDDADDDDLPF